MKVGVLFVCLGNICRSPSAQGIFQRLVNEANLGDQILVDSCGTAAFNVGKSPDSRAIHAASRRGYDIETYIARQLHDDDYRRFNYIISMDQKNQSSVHAWAPEDYQGEMRLLMQYCDNGGMAQVADPYYEKEERFDSVLADLEQGCVGLFKYIRQHHKL